MTPRSLAESLHRARYVYFDDGHELLFAWYGGLGVNVFDPEGNELDHWNLAGDEFSDPDLREVLESIAEFLSHVGEDEYV